MKYFCKGLLLLIAACGVKNNPEPMFATEVKRLPLHPTPTVLPLPLTPTPLVTPSPSAGANRR